MHSLMNMLVPATVDDMANHFGGAFLPWFSPILRDVGMVVAAWGIFRCIWCFLSSDQRRHTEGLKHALLCLVIGGAAWILGAGLVSALGNNVGSLAHTWFGI